MNPVVIIPTFIASVRRHHSNRSIVANYDHATPITRPGELGRCLASLECVNDQGLIIVLVSAEVGIEEQAAEKVRAIAAEHPRLSILVMGASELALVRKRMEQLNIGQMKTEVGLIGYGAIRNLGFVLADTLGFDAAVFLDDDEVIDDPDFLKKAMYGLGKLTPKGIPILAKTGYYLNDQGSYLSKWKDAWYNRYWQQGRAFNEWISQAMTAARLSRSNHVCGGCLAVHKEAFRRLAFDPWVARGEDLDYLLDLRMYGSDIWFDNQWMLHHLPPETQNEGQRFKQDVYRWMYEYRKLEYSRALIDLQQVKPSSLEPYPGPFLEADLQKRIRRTAFLRSLALSDKKAYRQAASAARGEAAAYAEENCAKYFEFQYVWPEAMARLDSDKLLTRDLLRSCFGVNASDDDACSEIGTQDKEDAGVSSSDGVATKADKAMAERIGVWEGKGRIDPGKTSEISLDIAEE